MPFINEDTLERIAAAARQTQDSGPYAGETTMRRLADAGEVGATIGLLSWADARHGSAGLFGSNCLSVANIPVDLLVALGGFGLSWFGAAGKWGRDWEMIGIGGLGAFLGNVGRTLGELQRAAAGTPAQASGQGGPEITGGGGGILGALGLGGSAHAGAAPHGTSYVVTEMVR